MKLTRLDLSEEYEVVVGEAGKRFTVPKCFLTKSSEFFVACCKDPWEEASAKRIDLPTVDLDQFSIYLQFLYTSELAIESYDNEDNEERVFDSDGSEVVSDMNDAQKPKMDYIAKGFLQMVDLATLGDFLRDAAFVNAISDAWIAGVKKHNKLPGPGHIRTLMKAFSPFSPFYKLNVDFFAAQAPADYLRRRGLDFPKQFVLDVAIEVMSRRDKTARSNGPSWKTRCSYHEHTAKVLYSTEKCSEPAIKAAKTGR